jgi:acetoacetyl-CoA synthetase
VSSPLWVPSADRIARSRLTAFATEVRQACGVEARSYDDIYRFSIERPEDFWRAVWRFTGIRGEMGARAVDDLHKMPGARFFPDARLNFAENLLRNRGDAPALISAGEGRPQRTLSGAALHADVARCVAGLRRAGIQPGDRVAAYMPNVPETIVCALAAAAIGAVWSSCSPDFGVQGVLDRFGQIEPRLLLACDGYVYGGRTHDVMARVRDIAGALPSVEQTVIVPCIGVRIASGDVPRGIPWADFLESGAVPPLAFEAFPFNHPLAILYSSGTTGVPKCIVHGAGGTLIQHLKEHQLLCDIQPGDRVFYFTTCGWMMWNWLLSALASGAALLLYDGSPFHPDGRVLFDLADETAMTLVGKTARFIDAVAKAGLEPIATHRLDSVRTMTSTGSPLAPESFEFVYEHVKRDIHLASISGGTDIVSCFVGGNPTGPVWAGEIQARALGMKVEVFDDHGRPVTGGKGELVCTMPFPSMPLGFWNDPDGRKYRAAYFETYPGVWRHGDYVELTDHGGIVIHGRSDAVLNPGGVRIGTAEIYRQVEQLEEVVESLVIGQDWEGDVRVVLFVKLKEGARLDDALANAIRKKIKDNTTPRHVPAKILQVADIPRTKSGKIVELAVRNVVHGQPVRNVEALANPEALEHFRNRTELASS